VEANYYDTSSGEQISVSGTFLRECSVVVLSKNIMNNILYLSSLNSVILIHLTDLFQFAVLNHVIRRNTKGHKIHFSTNIWNITYPLERIRIIPLYIVLTFTVSDDSHRVDTVE
jgi:hypothetical protein